MGQVTIHESIEALDQQLRKEWIKEGDHVGHLVFPYLLRAAAADRSLKPFELGRAIYHLAHRRGFLSNRKTRAREDQDGVVKQGIGQLRAEMTSSGSKTLGVHFSKLDPRERRIRGRYTDRSMYLDEFNAIRDANPWLPPSAWQEIHQVIFFQRKLKSAKHLIGRCSCIPQRRRAPMWHPLFQRYRVLEQVNNIRVQESGAPKDRRLTDDERRTLCAALLLQENMSAAGVKRTLKLKGAALSLEATGAGKLIGDRTSATMRKAFGEAWDSMSEQDRMEALLDVHSYEKGDALAKRAAKRWHLSADAALALVDASLEPGYASLSTRALSQLLPLLEAGLNSREAMDRAFPGRFSAQAQADRLAPVLRVLGDIRNPVVMRSLTEVRRIVNGVVRRWGRPMGVRIELARDIKRGRKERERMAKDNRDQERRREQAAAAIIKESTVVEPRRSDIEKLLLAEECGFTCPYTGRKFGMADLFGESPTVDVEHIIPYSRSLDDSFSNKTLCDVEENRNVKKRQTPFEAYSGDSARWAAIMERVKKFVGRSSRAKIERFELPHVGEELIEEFSSRQLNDTRYASRLAAAYVGQLYGGTVDSSGRQRVQVSSGLVTARMRQAWRVGRALHDDGGKNRADHRHHALDAIAVAMASPGLVRHMALAASRGTASGRDGKLLDLPLPWEGFIDDVKTALSQIVVSHRVDRRLAGALHEESNYSRPLNAGGETVHRVRKPVSAIDEKKADGIPDPRVRATVISALSKSGKSGLTEGSYPVARKIGKVSERVRRLRLPAPRGPVELGSGASKRWVSPGGNHHMAIYAAVVGGRESWEAEVVTRIEAFRRWRAGEPVVRRTRSDGAKLVFTLRGGDCIAMKDREGIDQWYVIATISGDQAEVRRHNDARSSKEIRKPGTGDGRTFVSVRQLKERGAQKFDLDPLGGACTARD